MKVFYLAQVNFGWGNDKGCNYSNTVIAYDVSELGYENCIR